MPSARRIDRFGRRHLPRFSGALLLAALCTLSAPRPVAAQLTPADSAAVLLQAATDFERQGRGDVADAIYERILERYAGTPAAAIARSRLTGPQGQRLDRTSRVELPVFGATYGLWLGVAVPLALNESDSQAYGLGLLLGGPIGLFSARAYNNSRVVSEGQARAISWGGIWGSWQGFGWTDVLGFGVGEICTPDFGCYPSESNDEERLAGAVVGGLAGIATGVILARNPVRSGVSSAAQGGSTWGSIYGAMASEMFDPQGDNTTLTTSLIAGNVGLLAGAALAARHDVGRPRIRMINIGALVGGLSGLGVDLLLEPDDDATLIAIPLAGSVAGMLTAVYATRNDRREAAEADDAAGGALFGYSDGRLSMSAPMPSPALLPMDDVNGRPVWRPGVTVQLFRARF